MWSATNISDTEYWELLTGRDSNKTVDTNNEQVNRHFQLYCYDILRHLFTPYNKLFNILNEYVLLIFKSNNEMDNEILSGREEIKLFQHKTTPNLPFCSVQSARMLHNLH